MTPGEAQPTTDATARMDADAMTVRVDADGHRFVVGERPASGGPPPAPDPFSHLYAALAGCVLITVRMYARRKGWPLEEAEASVHATRRPAGPVDAVTVRLRLIGKGLSPDQAARLVEIGGKCPVHRTLAAQCDARVVPDDEPPSPPSAAPGAANP